MDVHNRDGVFEGIPRVIAPDVSADRALAALGVFRVVAEVVVSLRIGPKLGIVALRGEHQRGATRPAAHHLRLQQCFVFGARGVGFQVSAELRHMRVELTEGDIRAVTAQHLRLRHRRQVAHLIEVAEDELASLDGRALAGQAGKDAAFDQRVADAVPVAQVRAHTRQHADL